MLSTEHNVSALADLRSRQLYQLKNSRYIPRTEDFKNIAQTQSSSLGGDDLTVIKSPVLSPSAVDTESLLQARSSFSPFYAHDQSRTRYNRSSDLSENSYRQKNQIDVIA
jgi:hypothetical protein